MTRVAATRLERSPHEGARRRHARAGHQVPPLHDFLHLQYAAPSPFWSRLIPERLGGAMAHLAGRLGVRPSVLTVLGGVCGVVGAIRLGTASDLTDALLAGVLLLVAYTFDCSDGQLARATGQASARGAWLDVTVDAVVTCFIAAAVAIALLSEGGDPMLVLLVAGVFGASRTASLFTSSRIRSDDGGMRLAGLSSHLRTVYTALIDTPFVYVLLAATRLSEGLFTLVVLAVAALTFGQVAVSSHHHFASVPRAAE
ncbi:CDP-alcohol phosphatidyltransferase [Geodermatophilus amargosae]|uniref:CDP-alcohol phosphatidyltransferase n=1 Tax=Geodermatophilus amargosae TaxID=1296565 RepID=A0A1I6X7J8_9ACTN|nr:CDP-alcohol phosphatidyltransferase family protein [Geodermatophilus amargosae]SFT33834.1 CDP-alcohol phosphatidyltransferase [Geodermatophilus amargosae]